MPCISRQLLVLVACCSSVTAGDYVWGGEVAWATAILPPHLAVLDGAYAINVRCDFARSPPDGGTFAIGINGQVVYLTDEAVFQAKVPPLVAGMWHSLHCMVLAADGLAVSSSNTTFAVRQGSSERAADLSTIIGHTEFEWVQHHDACNALEMHPLHPPENSARQGAVAQRSWDSCPARGEEGGGCDVDRGCEIEGLVAKDTHYPPHAAKLLEEHFYHFYVANAARFPAEIEYVPVMWISHMHNMQLYRLTYRPTEDDLVAHILAHYSDPTKRYFAVMQADYWPDKIERVIPANWLVFSASCATPSAWPIPLTTQFHPAPPPHLGQHAPLEQAAGMGTGGRELGGEGTLAGSVVYSKRYLASFIGRDTTWVRLRLRELLAHDPDFLIITDSFMINPSNQQGFRHVAAQSVFVLSPRGNGATSFRIFEALEHGSIPVYVFDDECCLPLSDVLDWREFAVLVPANEIAFLPDLVRSFSPEDIRAMQRRGAEVLRDWFALNSTCEYVLASLGRVKARWEDPQAPPLLVQEEGRCQRSAVDAAVMKLLGRMRREETRGGAGGDVGVAGGVTSGEMEAVGRMLVRRCVGSKFSAEVCLDALFLLRRAAGAAGGAGREGGGGTGQGGGDSAAESEGHSALSALGLATALVEEDVDGAERLLLESLARGAARSRALEVLQWLHGYRSPRVAALLRQAQGVSEEARRLVHKSWEELAWRGRRNRREDGGGGRSVRGSVREKGGGAHWGERYCMAPLDVGWGDGEERGKSVGGAVVAWVNLWHVLLACRYIGGVNGGAGGVGWGRTPVLPVHALRLLEKWRSAVRGEGGDGAWEGVESGDWLREASRTWWLSDDRLSGRFLWHTRSYGEGDQGVGVYEGLMVDWVAFEPALPLHKLRRHISQDCAIVGQELERMASRVEQDIVAFDALTPMADLLRIHCAAGSFPEWWAVRRSEGVEQQGDMCAEVMEDGLTSACSGADDCGAERPWFSQVLFDGMQELTGCSSGAEGGGLGWGSTERADVSVLLVWDESVNQGVGEAGREEICWDDQIAAALNTCQVGVDGAASLTVAIVSGVQAANKAGGTREYLEAPLSQIATEGEFAATMWVDVDVREDDGLLLLLSHARAAHYIVAPRWSAATVAVLIASHLPRSRAGGRLHPTVTVFGC